MRRTITLVLAGWVVGISLLHIYLNIGYAQFLSMVWPDAEKRELKIGYLPVT